MPARFITDIQQESRLERAEKNERSFLLGCDGDISYALGRATVELQAVDGCGERRKPHDQESHTRRREALRCMMRFTLPPKKTS